MFARIGKTHLSVEYSKNKFSCEVMDGHVVDDRYRVLDDIILHKDRIYLVPDSTLKGKIMKVCHDSSTIGHQGYFKTYRKIMERFSWKGLKDDVLKHIWECMTCQQNKFEETHPAWLLQPLPIPEKKWESISMDFITGMTCQEKKSEQTHPVGLLQPLPIPEEKWERISMDFITGLP
jgi:hypothetical protein